MIVDESIVSGGINANLLYQLITKHEANAERYDLLHNYYRGKHAIKDRQRESKGVANNKIVCNYAKYITDIASSYLTSIPISYEVSEGYDIEALKNEYLEQDIASLDAELETQSGICGRAYELVYANEECNPRSVQIPPKNAFVVYDDSCKHEPLFGVYYYKTRDIDGNVTGVVCNVYTDNMQYTYKNNKDSWQNMDLDDKQHHYFGAVPLIEYQNNFEKQGDFEQLIPLIDAYNILQSDRVNDKEQFVDAFLFLKNLDIDSEQAKKLREERILMGYENAGAEYLSKVMNENDIQVLSDSLRTDIHKFSCVPDLSDQEFGSNLSGVAIKYKLMGFEQHVRNKERYMSKGLKERCKLYNNYLSLKGSMEYVPAHRVDIVFTYNLPSNELEISQMVNYLKGLASNETLLAQLPFVTDATEEAELARKEQEEKTAASVRVMEQTRRKVTYNEEE